MAGLLLVGLAACLWGTVGVATVLLSDGDFKDPAVAGLVRALLGAGSLLIVAALLRLPRPGWRDLPLWALLLFGVAGATFQICLFAAFSVVGVTVTVAVTVCAPVLIVALVDAVVLRKLPERRFVLATLIASAGVLLALPEAAPAEVIRVGGMQGAILLAGASIAFAVLALVTRTITRRCEPVRAAGLGLLSSAIVLAAIIGLRTSHPELKLGPLPPWRDMIILIYIGVAATGGAYLAFVIGMHRCRSASVGLTATMIEPGVAALLAALILHERLKPEEALGCALMIAAMIFLSRGERRKPRAQMSGP
ncbi:DMT family transporter [Roseovarius autotrophicus]|uniref:DMT family transporter n=1 Tax=Roseovarius autotrophicus TaxID=2824121 RepID=UPI001B36671D|nr:DMT family transporter [Roseovarius autotrophicus]